MKKTLAKVQRKALPIVASHTYLTLNLPFGSRQLSCRKRLFDKPVQFFLYQTQTTAQVLLVATKVNAPHTCVCITHHIALYIVHQAIAFAQNDVQTSIHTRTAKQVIGQIKGQTALVVSAESTIAQHNMCLMRVHLACYFFR